MRWDRLTAEERAAASAERSRAERQAQGLPRYIDDAGFYARFADWSTDDQLTQAA